MRKKIVAGNWKMNCTVDETRDLLSQLKKKELSSQVLTMVTPPFTSLQMAREQLLDSAIQVAAQNMHQMENGAFTGEISASMLKSIGVHNVIIGHSERRAYFLETNEILAAKVNQALEKEMMVIFCFGEELEDRKAGEHFNVVKEQLEKGLFHLEEKLWKNIVLAYEPVWAIGTGETASPEQAQEMHEFIRKTVADKYSQDTADDVSILYGGSVKPANAKEIFGKPDVDGGLIGGAALDADSFASIVNAF